MTRNQPSQRDAHSMPEEGESAYEAAADVPAANVGPFRAGWEPEAKLVRLDAVLGDLSADIKYEDFLREPLGE